MANKVPSGARKSGEFVGTKLSRNRSHVTIWIEGRDAGGESVAGTSLTAHQLQNVIDRLLRLRYNMVSR